MNPAVVIVDQRVMVAGLSTTRTVQQPSVNKVHGEPYNTLGARACASAYTAARVCESEGLAVKFDAITGATIIIAELHVHRGDLNRSTLAAPWRGEFEKHSATVISPCGEFRSLNFN